MASRRSLPRRVFLPAILAAVLIGEVTGIALARTLTGPAAPAPVDAVQSAAGSVAAAARPSATARPTAASVRGDDGDGARDAIAPLANEQRSGTRGLAIAAPPIAPAGALRAVSVPVRPRAATTTGPASAVRTTTHVPSTAYRGANHVWIPSLGITKGIQSFPCSRVRPPDAGVYRWGCSGHNNVYLLSHAWSTFKPLHDAYVGGRLKKGMKVFYADGGGRVHTYAVIWWKVTAPTTAASWAWAPLSSPGMTLQTCVGSKSQYRLMVRLDEVG